MIRITRASLLMSPLETVVLERAVINMSLTKLPSSKRKQEAADTRRCLKTNDIRAVLP